MVKNIMVIAILLMVGCVGSVRPADMYVGNERYVWHDRYHVWIGSHGHYTMDRVYHPGFPSKKERH